MRRRSQVRLLGDLLKNGPMAHESLRTHLIVEPYRLRWSETGLQSMQAVRPKSESLTLRSPDAGRLIQMLCSLVELLMAEVNSPEADRLDRWSLELNGVIEDGPIRC